MNNLIEKITQTTEPSKLYQDLIVNLPIKLGLILLAVALITFILLIVMLGYTHTMGMNLYKMFSLPIVFGLGFCVLGIYFNYSSNSYEHNTIKTPVTIKDVKDLIHIDNNKLTIDPLTNKDNNLKYKNPNYDNNKKQIFKIEKDEFYENYKLIDENNSEIKITKEEYEELIKKGDK
jgi:hypothetical protein